MNSPARLCMSVATNDLRTAFVARLPMLNVPPDFFKEAMYRNVTVKG
jgi:hypothetical protein